MRISATPVKTTGGNSASQAAYTAARIESLRQTRDRQALADLQAGRYLPFLEYAKSTMDGRSGDERVRWEQLLSDTQDTIEEQNLAAGVNSGEVPLEKALTFFEKRRSQLAPHDPKFGDLTKQIADVKNAIEARDFNAELNQAQARMVAAGNTTSAKEDYLKTLVGAYTRAKAPGAQQALATQIGQLRTEIQKDHVLQRAQTDNSFLIRYYTPGSGINGQDVLNYLAQRAATAETPEEANRYATLSIQVATRERQLQTQRLRTAAAGGGGGPAGSPTLTQVANEIKSQTASTIDAFKRSVNVGRPDDRAFMLAREATDRELGAIDSALPGASAAAAKTLLARRDDAQAALIAAQRQGATKLVAIEQDSNTVFNQNIKELRGAGASPEEVARTIAARIGQITLRRTSIIFDGLTGDPQTDGELAKMETTTRGLLTSGAQDAARVLVGNDSALTKKIDAEYLRYRSGFVQQGKQPPVGVDEWMRTMTGSMNDAAAATVLGLGGGANDTRTVAEKRTDLQTLALERDNARRLQQERAAEIKVATDQYVASVWPRSNATGARTAYNAPAATDGIATGLGGRPAYFDPTRGGAFDPNTFAPLDAAHQRGGPQQADAGAGVAGVNATPPADPNAPADTGAGPLTGHAGPMALRANDPHAAADAFLSTPTDFVLPTWEIPTLPTFSPFAAVLDPGILSQYAAPPLPTFYAPSIAEAMPSPSGAALTAGNVSPAPLVPTALGSAPGEAAGGPALTA